MGLIQLIVALVVTVHLCRAAPYEDAGDKETNTSLADVMNEVDAQIKTIVDARIQTIVDARINTIVDARINTIVDARLAELEKQQKEELNRLQSIQNAGMVAFSVRRGSNYGPVTVDTIVTYPTVDLNTGGAFDTDSDQFSAPFHGIYHFHVILEHAVDTQVCIFITINRQIQSEACGGATNFITTLSVSLTVELVAGDLVAVELWGNNIGILLCDVNGDECQFGGFLVYQII